MRSAALIMFLSGSVVLGGYTSTSAVLVDFSRDNQVVWEDTEGTIDLPVANTGVVVAIIGGEGVNSGNARIDTPVNVVGEGFSFALTTSTTLNSAGNENAFNRDRGDSTAAPTNAFFRDFFGAQEQQAYTVTLSGLAAGLYTFTSWHYDPGSSVEGTRDVLLTDANGSDIHQGTVNNSTDTSLTVGIDPFLQAVSLISFQLRSNGVDPLRITYGGGYNVDFPINGFELTAIPEPASLTLVLVGLVAMMRRRNRGIPLG